MNKANGGLVGIFCLSILGLTSLQMAASAQIAAEASIQSGACVPAPAGLVGIWRGDGTALDGAGTNNGATPYGIAYATGVVGQAFDFDSSRRRVSLADGPAFILTNSITIEGWIFPRQQETGFIFFRGDNRSGLDAWTLDMYASGYLSFQIDDAANNYARVLAPIQTNQWQHIAATLDGASGDMKLYINGVLTAQTNTTVRPIGDLDPAYEPAVGIGNHGGTYHQFPFNGLIDELSLYSRALSLSEIQGIYSAGSAGKCAPTLPDSCTPAPTGLVSWWPGENSALDLVGGNNGVLQGGVSFGTGEVGSAFGFDGINGYVYISNSASLNPAASLTLEAWVYPTQDIGQQMIIAKWGDNGELSNQRSYIFGMEPGRALRFGISDVAHQWDGAFHLFETDSGVIPLEAWSHVAAVYDQSTGTRRIYVNGVQVKERTDSPVTILNGTAPVSIGAWVRGGGWPDESFFKGRIDEPSVYNRAISSNEIAAIYNAGSAGKCENTIPPLPVAPSISSQPMNKTVYVGGSATFSVVAAGDAPLGYQWRFNGEDLIGKTASSLSLANVQLTNAGNYSVVVTNSVGSVTSAVAVLTVNVPPPCTPPPSGLISWWRFENNVADNWDSNNGTTLNGSVYGIGKAGQAFRATGSSYVSVPDSASLRVTNGLTLEAWVNPTTLLGTVPRTIISKFDFAPYSPSGTQSSFYLGTTNNGMVCFRVSGTGSVRTNTSLVTSQMLPLNQWSFVVATYDGTALSIYINGTLAAQTNYSGGIYPGASNLGIGAVPVLTSFPGWPFSGLIDEVSIYNRALFSSEIQDIYNSDFIGKCLVAPEIVVPPQGRAVPQGEDVMFSVSAQGSRPLTYQWLFNGQILRGAAGAPLSTGPTLLLEKVQSNRIGNYSVIVSNVMGSVVSSNASLALLPPLVCTAGPTNMISWWPADGSGVDAVDGNHAPNFPSSFYATGKVGSAFSFDGYTRRVMILNSPSLNFGSNVNFSIEGWVKAYPTNAPQTSYYSSYPNVPLVEKRLVSGTTGIGYSLSLYQGRLAFWLGAAPLSPSNAPMFISNGPDLRDGMFHHVAVAVDRSLTNGGNLFVDGQLVLTFDVKARNGDLSNSNPLFFGAPTSSSSDSFFYGLLDEVAMYRRALSTDEVQAIVGAGSAGRCKEKPFIVEQPLSQRINAGSNVTFSVLAGGTQTLRYQWKLNGQTIYGATNASCTRSNVQLAFGGNYSVVVSNAFGIVTSSNAVLKVNRPPSAYVQGMVLLDEDTPRTITLTGSDPDQDALTFAVVTAPAHGSVSGTYNQDMSGTSSNFVYTPNANYAGQDSFTFVANDGLANSMPVTVYLIVRPVNDPPVAQPQSVSVDEDTPLAVTLTGFDVDGDALTFSAGTPAHGTLTGVAPNLVYVPSTNYNGPDSFTFVVNDGQLDSPAATVTITVRPVNDAPVAVMSISPLAEFLGITNLIAISPNNRSAKLVLDGSASSDVDHDPLVYSWLDGTNLLGTTAMLTNWFDVGTHDITLHVNDGALDATDVKTVEVITPAQALGFLVAQVQDSSLPRIRKRSLLASLESAAESFEHRRFGPGANQLQAFQKKVKAQVTPLDPVLAQQLIDAAQTIIKALHTEYTTVELLSSLMGQINESALPVGTKRSLAASVNSAAAAFQMKKLETCADHLRAFQIKVSIQVARVDSVLARQFTDSAEAIIDSLDASDEH